MYFFSPANLIFVTYTTPKNSLNSKESCVSQLKIQAHQSYTECNPEFTNRKNETYFMSNVPQISSQFGNISLDISQLPYLL